jgi:hypothetical protein
MLFQSVTSDITPLAQRHCGAGKLENAITDIRDDLASTLRDVQQAAECCERHVGLDAQHVILSGENGSKSR